MMKIDTKNDSISFCPMRYPTELKHDKKGNIYSSNFNYDYNGKHFVFNFHSSHFLYTSSGDSLFEKKNAKSKYVSNFVSYKANNIKSIEKRRKKFLNTAEYYNIIYDKYRNVYYRFVRFGVKITDNDDVMTMLKFPKQFAIMILDKDLNILGEQLMPKNTYNMNMYFVAPEGLYISTNHIKNPDFDEDYLKFELFELKEM